MSEFRGDMDVALVQAMATDQSVCMAARVSTVGAESLMTDESRGLINFLVKNRHGSPFEHATFTFLVHAPIFVWREIMRHRIASYNEESSRYKQLEPVFYLPTRDRNLVQVGKAGHYTFEPGDDEQVRDVQQTLVANSEYAYENYRQLLEAGVAREVARMVLPVNIYSSAYVTMNARALTNFLSLRTKSVYATFPSFPQREIEMVAEKMEAIFADTMPLTYSAWDQNGRVPL